MTELKINLIRIDDRLVHGQVMTSWLHYAKANTIMIIDDETHNNDYIKNIIELVMPSKVNVLIYDTIEGAEKLRNYINEPILVLVKYPVVLKILIDEGYVFNEIIVGGMGSGLGKKRLYKGVSISNEDLDILKKINEKTPIKVQIVPDEKAVPLYELI